MRARNPANPGAGMGMALAAWPAADRAAWEKAFQSVNGFSFGASPGAKLRSPSKDAIFIGYARWLVWIRDHEPALLAAPAAARATQARVCAYLDAITGQITAQTLFGYGCRLKRALQLMCPAGDWTWFDPIIRCLSGEAQLSKKAKRFFVPSGELYTWGLALMQAAEALPACREKIRAEQFRNGLMIAFLALRPLRLKNMIQLELGTQLVESTTGYDVTILPNKTKTRQTIEFPVPDTLLPAFSRYLGFYRKILAAGAPSKESGTAEQPDYVWLSRSGAQLPAHTFANIVTRKTFARFGQRLTPHEFRHSAASSIAEFNPDNYHFIRIILGHTTAAMAEQYYIRARSMHAVKLYQAEVRRKRKALKKTFVEG